MIRRRTIHGTVWVKREGDVVLPVDVIGTRTIETDERGRVVYAVTMPNGAPLTLGLRGARLWMPLPWRSVMEIQLDETIWR